MNIFFTEEKPFDCVKNLRDNHVRSQINEVCQMLSAWHKNYNPVGPLYGYVIDTSEIDELPWTKITHEHHPTTLWLSEGLGNVEWAVQYLEGLIREYWFRWGYKEDKYQRACIIVPILSDWLRKFPFKNFTKPPMVMPDEYKETGGKFIDIIWAYRAYYKAEKMNEDTYTKREKPSWPERSRPKTVSQLKITTSKSIAVKSLSVSPKTPISKLKLGVKSSTVSTIQTGLESVPKTVSIGQLRLKRKDTTG